MSGMELGKAAASAGAWAWKLLENPFVNFLKRRWEDTKSDSEKARYLQSRWNKFDWGGASERYKVRMREDYGFIRVLGSTEPKKLDDLFTDVYILEKPQAFRRFDVTKLQELQKEPEMLNEPERVSGLDIVVDNKRGHRLYILGQPGAGKTTFLKFLVHQTMVEGIGKIPIFISVKDWADSKKNVSEYIIQQFETCHFPNPTAFIEYILDIGKAIMLFDGLDEVKQDNNQRSHITSQIKEFCRRYSKTQTIVTCRIAATDYLFTEFTYVEISDFTDAQIRTYIQRWFGNNFGKAKKFLDELYKPENRGVRELGRRPLLLSLICLAYNETLHIPQRRVELYEESLDALLKKWDASNNIQRDEFYNPDQAAIYKRLSLGRKKQMLARIAAEAFEKAEIFFPKKLLAVKIENYMRNLPPIDSTTDIDGEAILRAMEVQHGILVERAQGIYSFSHLTFQEYFTAKYLVEKYNPKIQQQLILNASDARWREVFLLVASLLDDANSLLNRLHLEIPKVIRAINNKPGFPLFQSWVFQKSLRNSSEHSDLGTRSFYWYIALIFGVNPMDAFDHDLRSGVDSNLSQFINAYLDLGFSREIALEICLKFYPFIKILDYFDNTRRHVLNKSKIDETIGSFKRALQAWDEFLFTQPQFSDQLDNKQLYIDFSLTILLNFVESYTFICDFTSAKLLYKKSIKTINSACKFISQLSEQDCNQILQIDNYPEEGAGRHDWAKYSAYLRTLMIEKFEIGHTWEILLHYPWETAKYLQLNNLLIQSIDVAYINSREEMVLQILMP